MLALFIFAMSHHGFAQTDSIIVIESTEHKAEQLYNSGVKSFESANYIEAIKYLQLSILEDIHFSDAYFLLSHIQKKTPPIWMLSKPYMIMYW